MVDPALEPLDGSSWERLLSVNLVQEIEKSFVRPGLDVERGFECVEHC